MSDPLDALIIIFTEVYYWVTVVFMFFIHVGFCMYEVGASRRKNMMHTLMKNTMVIPLVTVTFFYFGWWIYFAWPNGPWITGGLLSAPWATPWSELMGTHMGGAPIQDGLTADDTMGWARINGVFWAAFLLFSWTAASIVSGAVIERIRSFAFWILAVVIGSFTWIIDAAWGWSPDGWMVQLLGYHDAYASGVIHAIAGGFALGVLVHLGPRLGKFRADGSARNIVPHNPWLVTIGLFMIYTGFWGFYVACNIPIFDIGGAAGMEGSFYSTTNIYLAPTTTSAITFNFLMSLSGGLMTGYIISKGDAFWTYSSGLAGIIAASSGNDLYHPIQAMVIARLVRSRHRRVRSVGLSSLDEPGLRPHLALGPVHRRLDHVRRAGLPAGVGRGGAAQVPRDPAHSGARGAGGSRSVRIPRALSRRGRRLRGGGCGGPRAGPDRLTWKEKRYVVDRS
jgi:ammonia channel protein AmtB